MTNVLLLHPICSTAVPDLLNDLLRNLSGCGNSCLRGTACSFTSEISTSNYSESMCQSHMLMNVRLGSLFKTLITHEAFLGCWNTIYRWMWSTTSFLAFLKMFLECHANRTLTVETILLGKKKSGCWSYKNYGWYMHCFHFLNEYQGNKQLCLWRRDLQICPCLPWC